MKTTAIVPVYNEGKTIKNVLNTLINSDLINEIIVVDDSSFDNTLEIVKSLKCKKLKIISLEKNIGKSDAVKIATKNLKTDVLFFCDGDLHNFSDTHIRQILKPFEHEKVAMSAGIRDYGKITNFLSKHIYPLITGERALSYSIFDQVKNHPLLKGYGLEVILNNYCHANKIPIYKNICKGLRQTNKPIKCKNGFYLLLKQSLEIIIIIIKLKSRKVFNKFEK
jgi:glycosyltransferase involved in cell wall biosynthesis